jgi:trans-aconitate 2-methyltransferase
VIEWYKGSGLRPYLDALRDKSTQARFLAEYRDRISPAFPTRPSGKVLFPFKRLFCVAYRD